MLEQESEAVRLEKSVEAEVARRLKKLTKKDKKRRYSSSSSDASSSDSDSRCITTRLILPSFEFINNSIHSFFNPSDEDTRRSKKSGKGKKKKKKKKHKKARENKEETEPPISREAMEAAILARERARVAHEQEEQKRAAERLELERLRAEEKARLAAPPMPTHSISRSPSFSSPNHHSYSTGEERYSRRANDRDDGAGYYQKGQSHYNANYDRSY